MPNVGGAVGCLIPIPTSLLDDRDEYDDAVDTVLRLRRLLWPTTAGCLRFAGTAAVVVARRFTALADLGGEGEAVRPRCRVA